MYSSGMLFSSRRQRVTIVTCITSHRCGLATFWQLIGGTLHCPFLLHLTLLPPPSVNLVQYCIYPTMLSRVDAVLLLCFANSWIMFETGLKASNKLQQCYWQYQVYIKFYYYIMHLLKKNYRYMWTPYNVLHSFVIRFQLHVHVHVHVPVHVHV